MADAPHILLFELYAGGHQLQYLLALADFWTRHALPGRLTIAVPRDFVETRPWLADFAAERAEAGVHLAPIDEPLELGASGLLTLLGNDLASGRVLEAVVRRHRPSHVALMALDHLQVSLARGLDLPEPVAVSGIYFQPSFHYGALGQAAETWQERVRRLRKAVTLRLALRNRHLRHLFCLDPYVVPHIRRMTRRVEVVHLPDGIPAAPPPDADVARRLRAELDVEPGRRLLLLFGSLARRKGTFELLDAVEHLPADLARMAAVAFVGRVHDDERAAVGARLAATRAASAAQLLLHDAFVPESDVQRYFEAADLVLLPYQRHVGSSGVLIRAAAAGRPVLAQDYGLVGAHTRRHGLGRTVDTTDAAALANALAGYLAAPAAYPCDAAGMQAFADAHTAERMAATFFRHLGALAPTAPLRTA